MAHMKLTLGVQWAGGLRDGSASHSGIGLVLQYGGMFPSQDLQASKLMQRTGTWHGGAEGPPSLLQHLLPIFAAGHTKCISFKHARCLFPAIRMLLSPVHTLVHPLQCLPFVLLPAGMSGQPY